MPTESGAVTAGKDNVSSAGPTPVAPDIGGPDFPSTAPTVGAPSAPPIAPTQHPQFFRRLLFSLGKGLLEGTQAGLMAPMNAQGPSIAATTAANRPMQIHQAMTSQQMDDLNVAMTQLKLHQLHTMVMQEDENVQNAAYNKGRDTLDALMEKGKADILATGDLKAVQDEYAKRQADAKEAGQGLLPIQILPSAGSSAKNPQFSLVMIGKDKLLDSWDETWSATELGVPKEDFDGAGATQFKFHVPAGMDQQKALQLHASLFQNWWTKNTNLIGQWKRNQANIQSREKEGAANRDMRLKTTELNNLNRRTIADMKDAQKDNDKDLLQALNEKKAHIDKLAQIQAKTSGISGWMDVGGGNQRAITTERFAIGEADKRINLLLASRRAIRDLNTPAAVPKGTVATPAILGQYLQRAGGDKGKARAALTSDGYVIPGRTQ